MLKKICLFIGCGLLVIPTVQAQDFEFVSADILYDTTAGVTPNSMETVNMTNYVKNLTNGNLIITWRNITDSTQNPLGWSLSGICDNITCYSDSATRAGATHQSAPTNPGATMIVETRVYASTDEPDGVGTYKVELKTLNQTDTAIFILTKDASTGISVIPLSDKRVSIYPNPASGSDLYVYIDQNLKAAKATIYSIIGREQLSLPVAENKDLTTFNVNSLPAGLYILRLTNDQGQTITSRKFLKK